MNKHEDYDTSASLYLISGSRGGPMWPPLFLIMPTARHGNIITNLDNHMELPLH